MKEILEVIVFIWPVAQVPLIIGATIIISLLSIGFILGLFGWDESAYAVGKCANYWWHENGIWFILLFSTVLSLLVASVKTVVEMSPLNWEVRQTMSDKDSKLNKSASYLWAYIKGGTIEKKEDIFLDIKKPSQKNEEGEDEPIPCPSGPGWWLKLFILFWVTFLFSFVAWTDELLKHWSEWRKRHNENKEAKEKGKEEPHEKAGFLNYFFPAFIADITTNLFDSWKKRS